MLADEEWLALKLANPPRHGRQLGVPQPNPPLSLQELATYRKGEQAIARTIEAFASARISRDDPEWQPGGREYETYKCRASVKTISKLQTAIVNCITERGIETSILHRRLGHDMAKRFLTAVNKKWKVLDKLVKDYNREL